MQGITTAGADAAGGIQAGDTTPVDEATREANLFRVDAATPAGAVTPVETDPTAAVKRIPNPVRLEGHTDAVPIHNSRFRSNWDLSAARSIALLTILTEDFGMPSSRISIAGYADTAPVADNDTEEGRSRNRRVDIIILNENGLKGEPDRYQK